MHVFYVVLFPNRALVANESIVFDARIRHAAIAGRTTTQADSGKMAAFDAVVVNMNVGGIPSAPFRGKLDSIVGILYYVVADGDVSASGYRSAGLRKTTPMFDVSPVPALITISVTAKKPFLIKLPKFVFAQSMGGNSGSARFLNTGFAFISECIVQTQKIAFG